MQDSGLGKTDNKVVIIGLDGASFDLIDPWVREGKLPNFAKLIGEGSRGVLKSTIPPMSPPAWTSFKTGVNPGKHGVFYFSEPKLDKPYQPVSSLSLAAKPFWEFISELGKKVGIVNVFGTFPASKIDGFIIAGRSVPQKSNFTYPPGLEKEIKDSVGEYVIDIDPYHAGPEAKNLSKNDFFGLLQEMLELRINAFWYLMQRYDPELFLIVFTATDVVQHFFYQYIDQNHPKYETSESKRYQNAILSIYEKIDEFLGKVESSLGHNGTLILASDHGAGPWYKQLSLNRWLAEQGLLSSNVGGIRLARTSGIFLRRMLPIKWFSKLEKSYAKIREKGKGVIYWNLPINWSRTKAFAYGHYGNIYINLKGREPGGTVEPGTEYENLCDDIEGMLMKWINPLTSRRVVKRVHRKDKLYSGDETVHAPDLVIEWEDYRYLAAHAGDSKSDLISEVPSFFKNVPQSGSHRLEGILIAKGPNIKRNYRIDRADITDVAPTVLYLFGCKIPSYMDGKVLTEIFEEPYVSSNPVTTYEPELGRVVTEEAGVFEEDEVEEIKRRLRALGYMD